ncbi:MAG: DUF997 family protein [Planctomycetota bacterium]|nr:MAG: DUF997 family protein [Planctomycetota bacterium]
MRATDRQADQMDFSEVELDPVFVHARREALVLLIIFAVFLVVVLATCYSLGTAHAADAVDHALVWGMPRWVWWGIVVPWGAANLVTAWFTLSFMREDALEAAESLARQQAETGTPSDGVGCDDAREGEQDA